MRSHALSWNAPFVSSAQIPTHPVLDALQHIQYGSLTVATPEGELLKFQGSHAGPDAYLNLHSWKALDSLVATGEVGFCEAYIDELWSSRNLTALLTFSLLNTKALETYFYGKPWYVAFTKLRQWLHLNSLSGSRRNIMAHYDLGNDFYALWLDKGMTYSCGLFEGDSTRSLEAAQHAKYQRILNQLNYKADQHILEIGCGWGGFAEAAARKGLYVTAITLSEEQAHYAQARIRACELEDRVTILLKDYREITEQFDHIVSIGMFEHVGEKFWPVYFDTIKRCLKPQGRAMIQTITLDEEIFETQHDKLGFVEQMIFPGGMLPSKSRFCVAATRAGLRCGEIFSFGGDYVKTLTMWLERFNKREREVRLLGYDEGFLRLWRFYLSACIASFASKRSDVMQIKLTQQ